ncbi:tRNA methyltransferase complex GCD14 subunit [Apiospora kogelbergensis]|uniref:tRNA (adenine(58)-N(1))-methyltransferase catalytic subunit TRM61 n=1 Tax=Apiospora kogelbergensis TaxID=1337665 RepID=A0AAW0QAA7_9PEZI
MGAISPFLEPGTRTKADSLAIVHLSRDNLLPVILQESKGEVDGYAEGSVINTRFGSFPHTTLINQPWGAQVRASIVDTGSRGRKRKIQEQETAPDDSEGAGSTTTPGQATPKGLETASSGFVHILPPTPEVWTTSLPHRTQVVYTPDYSYILHRIRARPGMRIIESGSGSGSFTHASVRAVYNGYPKSDDDARGKVYSFEFNEDRYQKMAEEVEAHGLKDLVKVSQRDVYNGGFLVDGKSPEAECVFLDLPAPWKALPHLSRSKPAGVEQDTPWISPLRSDRTVHLCTFSPCIEQVTKTVEVMRQLGWMEIEMVEVCHKRINVMRERVGLNMPTDRGSNLSPYDVGEAVQRLKEVESKSKEFHERNQGGENGDADVDMDDAPEAQKSNGTPSKSVNESKAPVASASAKPFMMGRLIHRTEPEIKTHTSYLVFAVLPQEWTEEQEAAAFAKWPCGQESKVIGKLDKESRKKEKRELLHAKSKSKRKRGKDAEAGGAVETEVDNEKEAKRSKPDPQVASS